jgi:hypothetical protein
MISGLAYIRPSPQRGVMQIDQSAGRVFAHARRIYLSLPSWARPIDRIQGGPAFLGALYNC